MIPSFSTNQGFFLDPGSTRELPWRNCLSLPQPGRCGWPSGSCHGYIIRTSEWEPKVVKAGIRGSEDRDEDGWMELRSQEGCVFLKDFFFWDIFFEKTHTHTLYDRILIYFDFVPLDICSVGSKNTNFANAVQWKVFVILWWDLLKLQQSWVGCFLAIKDSGSKR